MGFKFQNKPSKPVRGGSGHMVGEQTAAPSDPGKISVSHGEKDSGGIIRDIRVRGGSGHMCSYSGSQPAKPK